MGALVVCSLMSYRVASGCVKEAIALAAADCVRGCASSCEEHHIFCQWSPQVQFQGMVSSSTLVPLCSVQC